MTPRPIIIDTDPGQDDALAIFLALASPELEVLGLTAVAGNVPLHHTEPNCRRLVEVAGRPDVPVFGGCSRPMVRDLVTAEMVHGETGIDGADLPEPSTPTRAEHAVDWLVDTLMAAGDAEITLACLGPLTNIGMALAKEPGIVRGIREIVMMGGSVFRGGNVTPAAEFNIFVDPHAASRVFQSGVPLVLHPLDVTHQAMTTPERLTRFGQLETATGRAAFGMLNFYNRSSVERYGVEGSPLHDPCVTAYLIKPEMFAGKDVYVEIETTSKLTMGMTVADWWGVRGKEPNCRVINAVDADGYFDLLLERIGAG